MNTANSVNRRTFIKAGLCAAGAAAIATTASLSRYRSRVPENLIPPASPAKEVAENTYDEVARFSSPHADLRRIACGNDGKLYLAAGNYVTALDLNGQVVSEIGLSEAARCVAVGEDGLVYVGLRRHIEVFTATGERKGNWDGLNDRSWFSGLAVGSNDLFVADSGNRVIQRYDRAGKFVGRIGETNKQRNIPGFIVPSPYFDVELGGDGLLRTTNPGRHEIQLFTPDGDLEFAWGKASGGIDGFCGCCNPVGLALLPDGSCITSEKGLPRVKVFGADGSLRTVVAHADAFPNNATDQNHALDVAVSSAGQIIIADLARDEIRVMQRKV